MLLWTMADSTIAANEIVKLNATADIWLSDTNISERHSSAGKYSRFKLKSIQEMAAIRFDASSLRGREVKSAKLFMKPVLQHRMRYIRLSTVNQDWEEGNSAAPYGQPDGATWWHANANTQKPWAWAGSHFADVIMTSGNTLATWAALKAERAGWISMEVTPDLVYALIARDTDGLAVVEGGNPAYHNNFIFSRDAKGRAPYLEVALGGVLDVEPAAPKLQVAPAIERANLHSGALKITIQPAPNVFCWRLRWNNTPIARWRVKHPVAQGPTIFYLEDLIPSQKGRLEVVAVARSGQASQPTTIDVITSPTLTPPPPLPALPPPNLTHHSPHANHLFRVWALPGLIKVDPIQGRAMFNDIGAGPAYKDSNAVFDGKRIRLFGARGEYVSYQLCVEKIHGVPVRNITIVPQALKGPEASTIGMSNIELYKNWYAQNANKQWQPAYNIPMRAGDPFTIPDQRRGLKTQSNQTIYIDIYIPGHAKPGLYEGAVTVASAGAASIRLPVSIEVYNFALPDRLSFWPELNSYRVPRPNTHAYFRLAHQHRSVFMPWVIRPKVTGRGKNLQIDFTQYDQLAGPLLSGAAFQGNRRQGAPVESMYLPFEDSWPTPLNKNTYNYQGYWPRRGEELDHIIQHYLTAPYIGEALSQTYKDGIHAAQKQFIDHFKEKGWTRTEMHYFYGGKNTHRIRYGANMWWTTDEPYHWDDWLALQFFLQHWQAGLRNNAGADHRQWLGRADISRPQWQGRVLDHLVGPVYFGSEAFLQHRRCRILTQETGLDLRSYGNFNPDNASNTRTVALLMHVWLNGGRAHLPWQTLGNNQSLDTNDNVGGNAILVPGDRFGIPVVGDMRLKAARDGQQIAEYFELFHKKYNLTRGQVKALVIKRINVHAQTKTEAGADNADALISNSLKAWEIANLRRALADMIIK